MFQFLKFMNHKKSRLTDLFRKMDKNNDGLIPRDDFIDGIIKTRMWIRTRIVYNLFIPALAINVVQSQCLAFNIGIIASKCFSSLLKWFVVSLYMG